MPPDDTEVTLSALKPSIRSGALMKTFYCLGGILASPALLLGIAVLIYAFAVLFSAAFNLHLNIQPADPSSYATRGRFIFLAVYLVIAFPVLLLIGLTLAFLYVVFVIGLAELVVGYLTRLSPRIKLPETSAAAADHNYQAAAVANGYAVPDPKVDEPKPVGLAYTSKEVTKRFSGTINGLPFTCFTTSDEAVALRLTVTQAGFKPTIVNSLLDGKTSSLLPLSVQGLQNIRLEGDFGRFFVVQTADPVSALQLLTPDVMLTIIEKVPGADIECNGDVIDFVFHDADHGALISSRINALSVVIKDVMQQLRLPAARKSRRLSGGSRFKALQRFLKRETGWLARICTALGVSLVAFLGITTLVMSIAPESQWAAVVSIITFVPFVLSVISFIVWINSMVYLSIILYLLQVPAKAHEFIVAQRLGAAYRRSYGQRQ